MGIGYVSLVSSSGQSDETSRPSESFDPGPSLAVAVEALRSVGAEEYALIGAVALRAWGIHRVTRNVDIGVPIGIAERAARAIKLPGCERLALKIGGVALQSPAIQIDFIDHRFHFGKLYAEAIAEAVKSGRRMPSGSLELPVISLEYLVATKMVSAEPKDDLDIERILGLETLEYSTARGIVQKHMTEATANRLDAIARGAGRSSRRVTRIGEPPGD